MEPEHHNEYNNNNDKKNNCSKRFHCYYITGVSVSSLT